eukprot:COSAG02_NODE_1779_length_10950_cov_7.394526_1_plen_140_part_00
MAGTAIKDGLQELVTNLQMRESAAEVERQDDRRQSLTRMDAQVTSLEAAWKAMSDATGNIDDAETDASIAAYESQEASFTALMRASYRKIETVLEQEQRWAVWTDTYLLPFPYAKPLFLLVSEHAIGHVGRGGIVSAWN